MPRAALERRMAMGETEARAKGNKYYAEGYAAVFERRSGNLGGFVEVVKPTAFNKTIREADVRALWNHDPSLVLGRNKAGTLDLSLDSQGLHYRAELPNTSYGKDLYELLNRRDITQSSFTFFKVQDEWDLVALDGQNEYPQRSLVEVGLVDVSPVTFPAYEDATSGPARRAAFDGLAKRSGIDLEFFEKRADALDITRVLLKLKEPDSTSDTEPLESTQVDEEDQNSTLETEEAREHKTFLSGLSKEDIARLLEESKAILS
jgi:HK97 family phage prohead protease